LAAQDSHRNLRAMYVLLGAASTASWLQKNSALLAVLGWSELFSDKSISLLKELEELQPKKPERLRASFLTPDDMPVKVWCARDAAVPNSYAIPELDQFADACDFLFKQYFKQNKNGCASRRIFAGVFASSIEDLLTQGKEVVLTGVEWWKDYLRIIEDEKTFTKNNWIHESHFEDTLSKIRWELLDLIEALRPDGQLPKLTGAQKRISDALANCRRLANALVDLLYIMDRPEPAITDCHFSQLKRLAKGGAGAAGKAFEKAEDRCVFYILDVDLRLELATKKGCEASLQTLKGEGPVVQALQHAKAIASIFGAVRRSSSAGSSRNCTDLQRSASELQTTCQELEDVVSAMLDGTDENSNMATVAKVVGLPTGFFFELAGRCCSLLELYHRLRLYVDASSDFGIFACCGERGKAAEIILDLEEHLPELQKSISSKMQIMSVAYERLNKKTAPASRPDILEKITSLKSICEKTPALAKDALSDFRAVMDAVADSQAKAEVKSLEDGPVMKRVEETAPEPPSSQSLSICERIAAKDTRIYEAADSVVKYGRSLAGGFVELGTCAWLQAIKPVCENVSSVAWERVDGQLPTARELKILLRLAKAKPPVSHIEPTKWTHIESDGTTSEVDT